MTLFQLPTRSPAPTVCAYTLTIGRHHHVARLKCSWQALYESSLKSELKYGDTISLRHVRSGKFLDVDSKKYSSQDSSGRLVNLNSSPYGRTSGQFLVRASRQYFSDGEVVTHDSKIMLESAAVSEFFLESVTDADPINPRYRKVRERLST